MRFEFTRNEYGGWLTEYFAGLARNGRLGTREVEQWFPDQVRGTAPESPPGGFMVPPGMLEGLRDAIMDAYGLPRDLWDRPVTPLTRRQRLKRKLAAWRERAAHQAFRVIAGYDTPEEDCRAASPGRASTATLPATSTRKGGRWKSWPRTG